MARAKQRAPRLGTAEWSMLVGVTARIAEQLRPSLANPEATMPLLQSDAAWLVDLLNAVIADESVADRFFKTIPNRARVDQLHWWAGVDAKRIGTSAAALRWGFANAESLKRTLTRKKIRLSELPDVPPDVIEHHRSLVRQKRRTKAS